LSIGIPYNNIGLGVLQDWGIDEKAEEYYNKAIEI
jgi:hypothetical protein